MIALAPASAHFKASETLKTPFTTNGNLEDAIYDILNNRVVIAFRWSKEMRCPHNIYGDKRANKIEIANAIEEIFKVKVVSVNTINVLPKKKRVGRYEGLKAAYAKAMVKLQAGDKIEGFTI